jgi:hypothetical protein
MGRARWRAVLRHAALLALVCSLFAAAPARAERVWPARLAPRAKKLRQNPGRLGRGFMSDVFISRDGRHVIKKIKPTLGGVMPLGRAARAALAARSVTIMDVLRGAGLPVPAAVVPPGHPDMIVQQFAGEGILFRELPWSARPRALASAFGAWRRAVGAARGAGIRGVLIDPKIANFKFARDGRVVSWFDPAGVGGPWHWVRVRSRMLVRGLVRRLWPAVSRR